MFYVRFAGSDPVMMCAIENPIFVLRQRNGVIIRHPYGNRVQGVLSPDGREIWQLSGRTSLGEGYTVVEQIAMMEYDEWKAKQDLTDEPDPEDTEPVIPEGTEPDSLLSRAELTQKVVDLEDQLFAARIILGVEE